MKLIRDKIPGMPDKVWKEVDKKESLDYLKLKLFEEVLELADSDFKDINEYGDVLEVLMELSKRQKIKWTSIEVARGIKLKENGGFSNKVLIDV